MRLLGPVRHVRLKTLAQYINQHMPRFKAEVVRGYACTDRKIAGTRLRHPGKGREGNRLIVRLKRDGKVVLDHNAAETYRSNGDVVRWINENGGKLPFGESS